jgi:hypothetical protein
MVGIPLLPFPAAFCIFHKNSLEAISSAFSVVSEQMAETVIIDLGSCTLPQHHELAIRNRGLI